MSEQARLYGAVLYRLRLPEEMVQKALGVLEGTPELPLVLTDPTIPLNRKLAIISQIFSGPDFSPLIASFLKKACEAGCIGQFRDIVSACRYAGAFASYTTLTVGTIPSYPMLCEVEPFIESRLPDAKVSPA